MNFQDAVGHVAKFCHQSISWTGYCENAADGILLDGVEKLLRDAPLAVIAPAAMQQVPIGYCPYPRVATRAPGPLMDAWLWTLVRAGRSRVGSPFAPQNHIVVKADGLQDKASLYHVSFVYSDDSRRMSNFAHRLLLVGQLKENNQFHCLMLAATVAHANLEAGARGVPLVFAADWVCLKNLSRGLCMNPGGFFLKDPNARMPVVLACSVVTSAVCTPRVSPQRLPGGRPPGPCVAN